MKLLIDLNHEHEEKKNSKCPTYLIRYRYSRKMQIHCANIDIKETLERQTFSFEEHFTFRFMRRVCINSHAYLTGGR